MRAPRALADAEVTPMDAPAVRPSPLRAPLDAHRALFDRLERLASQVDALCAAVIAALRAGGRLLTLGNGGSAADAQHIAAELVGHFGRPRPPLPALALTVDPSVVTAIANDLGFEAVFARQIAGHGRPGDVLLALSTSGRSPNVLAALAAAEARGVECWALTGAGPNPLAARLGSRALCVPSRETPRIQEAHGFLGHVLCAAVDAAFAR